MTGSQNITEMAQDRTLTPEGFGDDFATQVPQAWEANRSSAFPWPVEDDGQDPFSTDGLLLILLTLK